MARLLGFLLSLLTSTLRTRASLQTEVAALRYQLPVYQRTKQRPRILPAERLIGSIRRELLDQTVVLNERHLNRVLSRYVAYYHRWRLHRSLEMDYPVGRSQQSARADRVVDLPAVAGLHHYYLPQAA